MLNRSFSRRIGKRLSNIQKNLLELDLPRFLFSPEQLVELQNTKVFLEIGFGMGEHFIHQAALKSDALHIGAEVYLNGVANVLKMARDQNINNFLLWPDDLDLILDKLPDSSMNGIYILFPDPWPKRKQTKKRIFNEERLFKFSRKLKTNGFIAFVSDIEDYFASCLKIVEASKDFALVYTDYSKPFDDFIPTKFFYKALEAGRTPQFFKALKV